MEKLSLYWLGPPLVEWKGRPNKLETRKAEALLVYLSLNTEKCRRETLATMFWQESSQQKALANLRRTLASLNASLPGWIEADRETIALKRDNKLWVDVDIFQRLRFQCKEHNHPASKVCEDCLANLVKAVELYRGDFLDGLNLSDSPIFDEWQFFQRDGLHQEFAEILQILSSSYAETCQWEQAILYARRWQALDRLQEAACRTLMDLYDRSGQRSAAMHQYEELTRLLSEHMSQAPEEKTRRLYEQIRGRDEAKRMVPVSSHWSSFPLLKTKLYIPTAPASRVKRSHLVARLREVEKKALTIISAPAGFGKTTLLAEWIMQTTFPVAWLSLDNGDNDPYRFLSYLISALESIHEDIGAEAQEFIQSPQLVNAEIILASLVNDLDKLAQHFVFVIDDYQFIHEHAVHEELAYLLEHIPSNMHIVIATRADPPLRLGRLRAHDQMLELRTQDLRFTAEEAAQLLNEVMRLGLSEKDIETLEEHTEGWVVGLKMAAISLQGRENASEFIRAFSGSHRYVLDYLVEEVLKRQPAHVQSFLLHTSILEKLNHSLCDALVNEGWKQAGESGQTVLENLESNNLFLIPLDDNKQWYRYHHLFADLLQTQLQKSLGNQDITRLHLRAAAWYEQNGLIIDSIHHASIASDDEMVERLIRQHYLEIMNRGEMSWVRYWMGSLSKELVYRRPWLCLFEAMNRAWFGQLEEANSYLNEAEKHIQAKDSAPSVDSMLAYHAYVRSRVIAMQGDTRRAIKYCLTAREHVPPDRLDLRIDFSITLGYEYFLYGDFLRADEVLNEMIRSGYAARAINNPVAAYCLLARSQVYQGRLHEADDLLHKAADLIGDESGQYRGVTALVAVEFASLLCEWNNLEAALVRLKRGLDSLLWWGKADDFCLAYITLARIYFALGDRTEAIEAVEKAAQLMHSCGVFSEAHNTVKAAQVKMWLIEGQWSSINHWVATLEKRIGSSDSFRYEDELPHITLARVFIAQNKAEEAIRLLSCQEESAQSGGRQGRLIEILLLKSLAFQTQGDRTEAGIALIKSLSLAEPSGYLRVYLDEGEPILRSLRQLNLSELTPPIREYVNRLLTAGT